MLDIAPYLLGAILGAIFFVPVGYIIRVMLSRSTPTAGNSPCVDEIYENLSRLTTATDEFRTAIGQIESTQQLQASKMQLLSQEWDDFYEKTRKSEERTRKAVSRSASRGDDEEENGEADQLLLEAMQAHKAAENPGQANGETLQQRVFRQKFGR